MQLRTQSIFALAMIIIHCLLGLGCVWLFIQIGECSVQESLFRRRVQKYLVNHVVETKQAQSERECSLYCVRGMSCASVNYKALGVGTGLCELNNKTFQETSQADRRDNPEFNHLDIIKKVKV